MTPRFLTSAALLFALASAVFAADETATEPEQAGPDFAVQGEYVAENAGAQVIALGEGKFHIVGWSHGLPGTTGEAAVVIELDGHREGDRVVFEADGWKGAIENGVMTGTTADGDSATLKHTLRESPTAGAKAPAGATVLFDGTSADAWEGGKIDGRQLLQGGTKTKKLFGDFTLHVEFRTPFMPKARGQGRGNSGVYLQDRFETQVLDSFGLKGENNECGGIYTIAKPRVNMCFPPLSWQTYDIDFEAAQFGTDGGKTKSAVVTVKHNGIVIHDHLEIPHTTGGAGLKEGFSPGPIALQNHGNPVVYRNIWIVEKK